WHTYGVIWTPSQLTYVIDGRVWGRVAIPSEMPHVPMSLNIQQQTWCKAGYACPPGPQSALVDWVAEYSHAGPEISVVGAFPSRSSRLGPALDAQTTRVVADVEGYHYKYVRIIGYGVPGDRPLAQRELAMARARAVAADIRSQLGPTHVSVSSTWHYLPTAPTAALEASRQRTVVLMSGTLG
ncbi:MAG: glycoside hydrolase family 16 protein, partial [Acidobacteria bacterium]|nr:glycoside hydrolase family 16 protein [Acidobacteriota bacterium]